MLPAVEAFIVALAAFCREAPLPFAVAVLLCCAVAAMAKAATMAVIIVLSVIIY